MNVGKRVSVLVALAVALAGCCTSDKCIAITTSNALYEGGMYAAAQIEAKCTEPYATATSEEEIKRLDAKCLPASAAYAALRTAHAALVASLIGALAGKPADYAALARTAMELAITLDRIREGLK